MQAALRASSLPVQEAFNRILHEAAYSHRTDSARDRRDDGSLWLDCGKIHIPAQFPGLRVAVHAHINHYGPVRDHVSRNELRTAYGNDKDFSLPGNRRKVGSPAMGYRDSRILIEKELCDRKPYNIAAPYYHGSLAGNPDTCSLEHLYDAFWSTREDTRMFLPEGSHVEGVESVHILVL